MDFRLILVSWSNIVQITPALHVKKNWHWNVFVWTTESFLNLFFLNKVLKISRNCIFKKPDIDLHNKR